MDGQTIPVETVVRFALRLGVIFALIFLIAVLTPWMAKKIDAWIARYRKGHDPKRDPNYGFRSIYELPPKQDEQPPQQDNNQKGNDSNG